MENCKERIEHERNFKEIYAQLKEQRDVIVDHDRRLDLLEVSDAKMYTLLEVLSERIKSLESTIKTSTGFIVATFVAFFIWYIQTK